MEYKREVGFHYHSQKKNNKTSKYYTSSNPTLEFTHLDGLPKDVQFQKQLLFPIPEILMVPKFRCWFAPHLMTMVYKNIHSPTTPS